MIGASKWESELFDHIVATLHAPAYRAEHAAALRQDWPRVPMPLSAEAIRASAALGAQLRELFDPDAPLAGVDAGMPRPELRTIAVTSKVGGGALAPDAGELKMTAGWGHAGKGDVVMPGAGRTVAREYSAAERTVLESGAKRLGLTNDQMFRCLGDTTVDVYLNDVAFWSNVPARVWDYTLAGYLVLKKWLSYREADLLGRDLRDDEVRYLTKVARRVAAILLLEPTLDASYRSVKEATTTTAAV